MTALHRCRAAQQAGIEGTAARDATAFIAIEWTPRTARGPRVRWGRPVGTTTARTTRKRLDPRHPAHPLIRFPSFWMPAFAPSRHQRKPGGVNQKYVASENSTNAWSAGVLNSSRDRPRT